MTTKELIEKLQEHGVTGYVTLLEEEAREIIKRLEEYDELKKKYEEKLSDLKEIMRLI